MEQFEVKFFPESRQLAHTEGDLTEHMQSAGQIGEIIMGRVSESIW